MRVRARYGQRELKHKHSIVPLGLAMPLMLKLGVLLTIGAVFLGIGSITFGGGFVIRKAIK